MQIYFYVSSKQFSKSWAAKCYISQRGDFHKPGGGEGSQEGYPDSKVHGANMGPTWVLSAPDGSHVGPMNLDIWVYIIYVMVWFEGKDEGTFVRGLKGPILVAIFMIGSSEYFRNNIF